MFASYSSRRRFLLRSSGVGLGCALGLESYAQNDFNTLPDGRDTVNLITRETQQAIDRALAYLANTQNRDGSFGDRQYAGNIAVTALCGLAFMAGGHFPGRGTFGGSVTRALQYVLGKEKNNPPGFLYHESGMQQGPMYSHGFGLLFLTELYGMVPDLVIQERLKGTIQRAVEVVRASQNNEGGWRYQPVKSQADISVTICQIMALRSARNAGFFVEKSVVDKCIKYVRNCQSQTDGGFTYFANQGGSAFARSAAGVVALYCAGIYEGQEIRRGLNYLRNFKPGINHGRHEVPDMHYFYGQYYAAQAMWTAGGKYWTEWFPAIRDELLNRQRFRTEGGWADNSTCHHYGTAMATIILQIPNNYLPILQK
jgi:hypothetical protein